MIWLLCTFGIVVTFTHCSGLVAMDGVAVVSVRSLICVLVVAALFL